VIGFISAAAFAGVWATKLGRIILPQPHESKVSDFLPFNQLMADGMTIRCHNGSFVRVFKVEGMDLSFATGEKAASMGEARKSWIDSMSDLQVVCRVLTLRDRIEMEEYEDHFNNQLLEQVAMTWKYNLDRIYSNKHYIIISVPDRNEALKDLNYASQTLLATLNDYGVSTMFETEDSSAEDSPLHVFAKICSPISQPRPKARNIEGARLNEMLTADHIHFTGEKGVIKFFSGEKEKYAITMGIRSSGDYMDESMIVSLLSIDCEMTLLHNIRPIFKPKARALLMQQQRMANTTKPSY
jgi:type IV secretory pathway VirB4 component